MSRQQILPSRVTAQKVRFHWVPEFELTWDFAAEDHHVGQIFRQFARRGGCFAEQATGGEYCKSGLDDCRRRGEK